MPDPDVATDEHDPGNVEIDLRSGGPGDDPEALVARTLWPALHGETDRIEQRTSWWDAYEWLNDRVARTVARTAGCGADVWIHGCLLFLVPRMLRRLRPDVHVGLSIHSPVVDPGALADLDHGADIAAGLGGAHLLGTQRAFDARMIHILVGLGAAHVAAFPPSIDIEHLRRVAASEAASSAAARVRRQQANGRRLLLAVDPVDPLAAIPERIEAFGRLLDDGHASADDLTLVQMAVPSADAETGNEVERLTGAAHRVNQRHRSSRGAAVHVVDDALSYADVVGHYLAADTLVATPRRDGMTLAALEFVATRAGDDVGLVLSRKAGATEQLGRLATVVDGDDVAATASALRDALETTAAVRRERGRRMAELVEDHDPFDWVNAFLDQLRTT